MHQPRRSVFLSFISSCLPGSIYSLILTSLLWRWFLIISWLVSEVHQQLIHRGTCWLVICRNLPHCLLLFSLLEWWRWWCLGIRLRWNDFLGLFLWQSIRGLLLTLRGLIIVMIPILIITLSPFSVFVRLLDGVENHFSIFQAGSLLRKILLLIRSIVLPVMLGVILSLISVLIFIFAHERIRWCWDPLGKDINQLSISRPLILRF